MAVYYKSANCNPLTALLRFVADLLYKLHTVSATVDKILTDSASRGPSAVAELLVHLD